jgi:regulator of RNase E activity RraA
MISAVSPEGPCVSPMDWWNEVRKYPKPRVVVLHDIDNPVVGSFWGEVNANIHRALACVGTVTDGSVRDLDEVEELGFHFFSSCVTVSHAYVHMIDFGIPVTVGGLTVKPGDLIMGDKHGVISIPLTVKPGDLIMGDKHGVISIPPEIAKDIPTAAQMVEDWERRIIDFCKSDEFTLDGLKERYMSPRPAWPQG